MRFLRGILSFILAITLTAFAIFNRHNVEIHLSPLHPPFELPLYMIALSLMAFGFVLGGMAVWFNGSSTRRTGRKQRKIIKALEKELSSTKEQQNNTQAPPADFFPALPATLQTHEKDSKKSI